jgi:hypothetical protein
MAAALAGVSRSNLFAAVPPQDRLGCSALTLCVEREP